MDRRPTHAAGYSWRKWQDPLIYGVERIDWVAAGLFWVLCLQLGAILGVLASRL